MSEVRAKKALGQHFLVDLNIARKICDSLGGGTSEKPCPVLEVGCGMGVLTRFLLKRTDVVTYGAEIDSESVAYLHAHYPEFTPRLMEGDFLKMDLRTLFPEGLRVIGNFPYNISSQIFFKVLENRDLHAGGGCGADGRTALPRAPSHSICRGPVRRRLISPSRGNLIIS